MTDVMNRAAGDRRCRGGARAGRRAVARAAAAAPDARRRDRARPRREPPAGRSVGARRGGRAPSPASGTRRRCRRSRAQAGYMRTNHVDEFGILLPTSQLRVIYPDIPDNYRTRLDLQWPIYTGGRLDALERAARVDAAASGRRAGGRARATCALEITRAYWALVTASESVRVVDESVDARSTRTCATCATSFDAGLVPPNDVLDGRSAGVAAADAHASRRARLRDVAEAELGAPRRRARPARRSSRRPRSSAPPAETDAARDARSTQARRRPARARGARQARGCGRRARPGGARPGAKPTVAVGGGVDYAAPEPAHLPARGRVEDVVGRQRQRELAAVRRRARRAARSPRRPRPRAPRASGSPSSTRRSPPRCASALSELRVEPRRDRRGRRRRPARATEARRVVGERFTAGVATSTDVLDAQVALLQAELDRTQALASARLAEARLRARPLGPDERHHRHAT